MNEAEIGVNTVAAGASTPSSLAVWRDACERANDWGSCGGEGDHQPDRPQRPGTNKKRIQQLERELARKEKGVGRGRRADDPPKKKVDAIWGRKDGEDE